MWVWPIAQGVWPWDDGTQGHIPNFLEADKNGPPELSGAPGRTRQRHLLLSLPVPDKAHLSYRRESYAAAVMGTYTLG